MRHRQLLSAGAPPRLQQAAGQCALCAVGYLLAKNMLSLLARGLLAAWLGGPGVGTPAAVWECAQWTLSLAAGSLALLAPVWAARRWAGLPPAAAFWCRPPAGSLRVAFPVYLGAAQLGNLLAGVVARFTGSGQSVELPQSAPALVPAFLTLCVMPAVLEELLFRGVMQSLLRPHGAALAIVGQAVLFALLHGSLSGIVFALPAGLFFGLLAELSGSLWPGAVLHFSNNALAFVLLWLECEAYDGLAQILWAVCITVFPLWAAAALARAALRRRPRRRLEPGASPLALTQCPAWLFAVAVLAAAALAQWLAGGA